MSGIGTALWRGALALGLLAAAPGLAQESERLSRPGFLAAMGLLETAEVRLPLGEDAGTLVFDLPSSDQVRAVRNDDAPGENVVAVYEFRVADGRLVESLVLTRARVAPGPAEERRFAMANLLVLRSFGALVEQQPGARLLGFGPVTAEGGAPGALDAVQAIGTRPDQGGGEAQRIVVRHVGLMDERSDVVVVALVGIDSARLPVQNDAELGQTYTGLAIASMRMEVPGPASAD
jgi:hypothetical protein